MNHRYISTKIMLAVSMLLLSGIVQAEEIDNFPVIAEHCIPANPDSESKLEFSGRSWTFKRDASGYASLSCAIPFMNNMKDEYDEELDYSITRFSMHAFDHDREETRVSVKASLVAELFFVHYIWEGFTSVNTNDSYHYSGVGSDALVSKFSRKLFKDGKDYILMKPGWKYKFIVKMYYDPIVCESCIESIRYRTLAPKFYGILLNQKTYGPLPQLPPDEILDPGIIDPIGKQPL